MAAYQPDEARKEREFIREALKTFFDYVDCGDSTAANPPPRVEQAFKTIVEYYTQRLIKVVRLLPTKYISRVLDSNDLYLHAVAMLWQKGRQIRNRTEAGVYQWLKTVIIHYKLDVENECLSLSALEPLDKIERLLYDPDLREFLWDDEVQYRCDLIWEFFEKALSRLDERRRQVIRLVLEGKSVAEIKKLLGFPTKNAVSSYKRKAFEKIAKHLNILLLRELDSPTVDLRRKEIIEELLERFYYRGDDPPCLLATA
jgi:DNA-directed RNA polymerase specialized sigma24 family protein